ncbi:MAG: CotH kinase family protein [Lachnospiraceae bacterium]|nr:CotH kinase family protein [Lachnospiraceae bacterium]
MSKRNLYIFSILTAFTAVLAGILYFSPRTTAPKEVIICDVRPDSARIIKDDGSIEFSDHLYLKNVTDHPYDLTGLYLSDSPRDNQKLPLDGIVIEPFSSIMIKLDPSWNFALKSSGEEIIYLTDKRGNILYKYDPALRPEAPQVSAESGFYDKEFDLTLLAKEGDRIFYTLDGSDPDENSEEYTGPIHVYDRSSEPNTITTVPNTIKDYYDDQMVYSESDRNLADLRVNPVDKAFIVRAVAVGENGYVSEITTNEYFFCGDKYKNVISVITDPENLFGSYGILSVGDEYDEWYNGSREGAEPSVNFMQSGREWEVPAEMDYFRSKDKVFTQRCGLRLQGRSTRYRRLKNFQLRARHCYSGSDVFEYDFWENEKYRPDAIILDDRFKESFFFDLIEDEDIIKQKTTDRVALFLNGEFWQNIYIRQKINTKYYTDHYGMTEDNLLVYSETLPTIGADDQVLFDEYRNQYLMLDEFAATQDLSKDENYAMIQQFMDLDTYIDYLAINIWVACGDWGEFENDECWKVKEPLDDGYCDGRLRWTIHDGDNVFNIGGVKHTAADFVEESVLYQGLMKNEDFKVRLKDRINELGETCFSDENVQKEIDSGKWDEPELEQIEEFFATRKDKMAGFAYDVEI